jgi:cysteine sulfinate desulfinase/cysteine desulfurase-like protein
MRRVYLDYNATAPLLPEALEAAVPYYTSVWEMPPAFIDRVARRVWPSRTPVSI